MNIYAVKSGEGAKNLSAGKADAREASVEKAGVVKSGARVKNLNADDGKILHQKPAFVLW